MRPAFLFTLGLFACGGGDQVIGGRLDAGPMARGGPGGALDAGDAGSADGGSAGRMMTDGAPTFDGASGVCTSGSSIAIPTPAGNTCAGDIADRAFRFAVCTCTELAWVGTLATDSFDSTTGQKGSNASVGADGYVVASQPYHIGGSFWIAGQPAGGQGLTAVALTPSDVTKELHVGGGIVGQSAQTIHGDAFSEGAITSFGMNIDGALHVPVGAMVTGVTAVKGIVREAVSVPKPCDCGAPVVDTAAVVDALRQTNDDAALGLAPADLADIVGAKTVDLACGRYYFDQISGQSLTLAVHGPAALSVGANVALSGSFEILLDPGAELDLFVEGDMKWMGAAAFGTTSEPARTRVYVGGGSVFLPSGTTIGANLYAPAALVSSGGALDMYGSLFADRFSFGGSVTVHYDEAILGGRGCASPPPPTCASCRDCPAASACRQTTCGTCAVDADCCPPFVCTGGTCRSPADTL